MQVIVLALLVMGGIVNYLDRSALAVADVVIRQELGLSATSMGVLLSAFLLAYAFSQIVVGISIDRLGPRILLLITKPITGTDLDTVSTRYQTQ